MRPSNELKIPLCTDPNNSTENNISMGNVYLRKPILGKQSLGVPTTTIISSPVLIAACDDTDQTKTNTEKNVILSDKRIDVIQNEQFVQEIVLESCLANSTNCAAESPTGLRKRNVYFEFGQSNRHIPPTVHDDLNKWMKNNQQHNEAAAQIPPEHELVAEVNGCDDDGFESFNGKSSSGEEHTANRRSAIHISVNEPAVKNRKRDGNDKKDKHSDIEINDTRPVTSNVRSIIFFYQFHKSNFHKI